MDELIELLKGVDIDVPLQGRTNSVNLADLFIIDESNLTSEMARQAALYAYLATATAEVDGKLARLDNKLERLKAQLDEAYRESFAEEGIKATEARISNAITANEQVVTLSSALAGNRATYKMLKALERALEQRADMLISMGANMRHELDQTGMNIRESSFAKAVKEAREVVNSKRKT